jgi:hypothetical protein
VTSTPACGIGDLNCNGFVDETDLAILIADWSGSEPAPTPRAGLRPSDINGENHVDETDLAILVAHWKTK